MKASTGSKFVFAALVSLGTLGWAQVASGNLIAALVMGGYMWRTHPELKDELSYALGGQE